MKKQAFNPILPSCEYIPDGEPHVFGDRLYLFGSHDIFGSNAFCVGDYVCWSAPISNLANWKYHGVIYTKAQHQAVHSDATGNLYAPDVAQGKDGRYYLYYSPANSGYISVAVCDTPAGKYQYYGDVRAVDGEIFGLGDTHYYQFDPAIFVDDDGKIYLYSGSGQTKASRPRKNLAGAFVVQLNDDMLNATTEQKIVMPVDDDKIKPNFFEGSSMRKINGKYYFIYYATDSSGLNYLISDKPDSDFVYGGIVYSASDVGINGHTQNNPSYVLGNNHGSIEKVGEKIVVFNHRQTHINHYSRQAIAEEISIDNYGKITQAEHTSCGLNGGALIGRGSYNAGITCNLYIENQPHCNAYITQENKRFAPKQYIKNIDSGTIVGYKYFDFCDVRKLVLTIRGNAKGTLTVLTCNEKDAQRKTVVATQNIDFKSPKWHKATINLQLNGIKGLFIKFEGEGVFDLKGIKML